LQSAWKSRRFSILRLVFAALTCYNIYQLYADCPLSLAAEKAFVPHKETHVLDDKNRGQIRVYEKDVV
jgi:hypothetical protein